MPVSVWCVPLGGYKNGGRYGSAGSEVRQIGDALVCVPDWSSMKHVISFMIGDSVGFRHDTMGTFDV